MLYFPSVCDEFFSTPTYASPDVIEEDGVYKLLVDIPGIDKKDISIEIENGMLTILGENKPRKRSIKRVYKLSEEIDQDNIEAQCDNGVLEVVLKKQNSKKNKIQIK